MMHITLTSLTRIILLGICCLKEYAMSWNWNGSWEAALQDKLLTNRRLLRPAKFDEEVPIDILMAPTYLQEINTARQTFSIVASFLLTWQDESLSWNPADYGNVTFTTLPAATVWMPQTTVLHGAVIPDLSNTAGTVDVTYRGQAAMVVGDTLTTFCAIDATFFPFDTQTCKIIISAWGLAAFNQNYTGVGILKEYLVESNTWELLNTHVKNNYNSPINELLTSLPEFIFEYKRRPEFYVTTMIVPLGIMTFLGLLVFPLPPQSGEKVSYGITCFLSFFILQTSILQHLPSSFTHLPYIVRLLLILKFLNALFLTMTVTSVRIVLKKPIKKIPRWLGTLFGRSNKIVNSANHSDTLQTTPMQISDLDEQSNSVVQRSEVNQGQTTMSESTLQRSQSTMQTENSEDDWGNVTDSANMMFFWLSALALVVTALVFMISIPTS